MPLMNAIISISCAIMWLVYCINNGFTGFHICVTVLWFVSALLHTIAYIKRKGMEDK